MGYVLRFLYGTTYQEERKKFQAGILILVTTHLEMIRKVMLLLQQHHYDGI